MPVLDTLELKNSSGQAIYKITLDSVVCDSTTNQQTWTYTVTELGGGQDISNWALELCDNVTVINPNPETDEIGPPGGGEGNCLNGENTCDEVSYQIKWNLNDDFTSDTFSFTLTKCYQCKKVITAIKAGNNCFCGLILGPSCTEGNCDNPPPVTRGILFI